MKMVNWNLYLNSNYIGVIRVLRSFRYEIYEIFCVSIQFFETRTFVLIFCLSTQLFIFIKNIRRPLSSPSNIS